MFKSRSEDVGVRRRTPEVMLGLERDEGFVREEDDNVYDRAEEEMEEEEEEEDDDSDKDESTEVREDEVCSSASMHESDTNKERYPPGG